MIGERSNVWPGAVIRGDFGKITIGDDVSVEDNCVIHSGSPSSTKGNMEIGNRVHIGHGAVLNCTKISNSVLIGMNATILHDVEIGEFCIIGAGAMLGQGMIVPDRSLVVGIPGKIIGEPTEKQLWWVKEAYKDYAELTRKYKEEGL